jgi:hypothetical protein
MMLLYSGLHCYCLPSSAAMLGDTLIVLESFVTALHFRFEFVCVRPVTMSVILVGAVLAFVQLVAVPLHPRVFYGRSLREVGQRNRALIVGAGEAGVNLARPLVEPSFGRTTRWYARDPPWPKLVASNPKTPARGRCPGNAAWDHSRAGVCRRARSGCRQAPG